MLSAAVGPTGKVYGQNLTFSRRVRLRRGREDAQRPAQERDSDPYELADAKINGTVDAVTALNMHDIYNGQRRGGRGRHVKGVYDAEAAASP